jgi:hypothetical protein
MWPITLDQLITAVGLLIATVAAILMYYFPARPTLYTVDGQPIVQWLANQTPEGKRKGKVQLFLSKFALALLAVGFLVQLVGALLPHDVRPSLDEDISAASTLLRWLVGLLVSLVLGSIFIWFFLLIVRRDLPEEKPPAAGAQPDQKPTAVEAQIRGVPASITGMVERLFFTVLVAMDASGVPTAMVAWIGVKMAANWNRPGRGDSSEVRVWAISALLAGLISMLFAYIGGWICSGVIGIGFG